MKRWTGWAAGAAAALILSVGVAIASPAPRVTSIASLGDLHTPLPYPYDQDADAQAHVDAALAQARREHKLAFIDLGGNWCGDCRILAGLMELPEYRRFIDAHYVVTMIDVGRFNRNLDVPARFGVNPKLEGVPAILIVDPATDRLVDAGHIAALDDARDLDPQSIMDWIAKWAQ
ncbi:MAG TPA: thioredoxin family protein [Rhizomicrobium sp.]|nr:thioredoxin family protein [Rhizomicrobium sp.]